MIQIKAKITVNFTQPLAKTIERALYPDNKPLPHDLVLESKSTNKKLFIYIEYNGENILRLFSTIDELVEAISLTIKTSDIVNSFSQR
ncbi:MAG: hypothetical protein ACP5GU_03710 [Thermoprotei archaeon]|jgi:hypothetical protein